MGLLFFGVLRFNYIALAQGSDRQDGAALKACELLKEPASFDGKELIASGVAGNSFHQVDFWDPECALPKHGGAMHLKFADNYQLGQPGDKKYLHMLRKDGAVGLTVRGRFVASGGPFGPEGDPYRFLISSVVEVRKLSKEYRQRFDIGTGKTNAGVTETKRSD
jgi:hypothetical protein